MINQSHEVLTKSLTRRVHHLMVQCLDKFEQVFDDSEKAKIFKHDLKNAFNDVIRAQRDELQDYEVEYKPFRFREDNILSMTKTMMETIQKIEFLDKPSMKIFANIDKFRVLSAVRNEFNCGIIYEYASGSLVLEIVGVGDCVNNVVPIMDRYKLNDSVRAQYKKWRSELVNKYRS